MAIRDKRRRLASLLAGSGVLGLLERAARRPGLLVVNYHRVGDARATQDFPGVFSATVEDFQEQIERITRVLEPIGLPELVEAVERDQTLRSPRVLFTFDDAYRDQGEVALPFLIDRSIPTVLFVATDFLNRSRLPWWDLVSRLASQASRPIHLTLPARQPMHLDPEHMSRELIREHLIDALWNCPDWNGDEVHDQLIESSGIALDEAAEARGLFLDWHEVLRLRDAGVAIGSHTRGHQRLGELSDDEQSSELVDSMAELTERLGEPPLAIAYPFGGRAAVNPSTARLAESAGYRLGFRFDGGMNPAQLTRRQRFDLARIGVSWTDSPAMVRARVAMLAACRRSII